MPNSPPALPPPPNRGPMVGGDKSPSTWWQQWFGLAWNRMGGVTGKPIIGDLAVFETTIGQADLASAATVTLIDALSGERWKIREIFLSGGGTNFSGGDRLLTVGDGTAVWTVIPAATLQSLSPARWGDTGTPFPATAAHLTLASASGTDVTATYSGGATDYTAGSLTLMLTAERIA